MHSGIDVLVTPVFPTCSMLDSLADDVGNMLDYLHPWSILHYPAGSIPVTSVQQSEQSHTDHHNDAWTKFLNQNAANSQGMPISVQVISHFYEDEKALAVMKHIEEQVGFRMKVDA